MFFEMSELHPRCERVPRARKSGGDDEENERNPARGIKSQRKSFSIQMKRKENFSA